MMSYGKGLPGGDGALLLLRTQPEHTREPRRLMMKLSMDEHVDISRAPEGTISLTAAGVTKMQEAANSAPALWQCLQQKK